jgi:hypothetical protein
VATGRVRSRYRRPLTVAGVVALTVLLTWGYVGQQREVGDALLAARAIEGLAGAGPGETGVGTSDETTSAYLHYFAIAERNATMYLNSEAARSPGPVSQIARAWLAVRVSEGLLRLSSAGESSPAVASVPGGEEAAAAFPEVAQFIRVPDGGRRFIEVSRLRAVLAEVALAQTVAAAAELKRVHPSIGRFALYRSLEGTTTGP